MDKPVFSDIIQVRDGAFLHFDLHAERIRRTVRHFFHKDLSVELSPGDIPNELRKGIVKCRIEYSDGIRSVSFSPYRYKQIERVALMEDNTIEYPFKSTDRKALNDLLSRSGCDEIMIVKNGHITDSSFSNLVFENETGFYTPDTFLLPGTQRQRLIREGIVQERPISVHDLDRYQKVYFINAMIDLNDRISVPIESILT